MPSEEEVLQYLTKNDCLDVFTYLIISADNLRNRGILLKGSIDKLDENIVKALEKIEENPDVEPTNKEVSSYIKDIHYAELEVIQRLNILIELLSVYYHIIRTDLRELPKAIGKSDISVKEIHKEFEYFKNQTLVDIWTNFRFPNTDSFPELTAEERKVLRSILEESAKEIHRMFGEIFEFQRRFRPIYNKYKHSLGEITGIYGINKEQKKLETQLYLRLKQNENVQTYVVGAGSEEAKYLQEISGMTYEVLRVLIDSALLFLVNIGKNFAPKTVFVGGEKGKRFLEICSKVKSCRFPNFDSLVRVRKPDTLILQKFNREISENHIYIMNKDIMDQKGMLREGVKLSGKTEVYIKEEKENG